MSDVTAEEMAEVEAKYEAARRSDPPGKVNADDVYLICGSFRAWVSRQFYEALGGTA